MGDASAVAYSYHYPALLGEPVGQKGLATSRYSDEHDQLVWLRFKKLGLHEMTTVLNRICEAYRMDVIDAIYDDLSCELQK